MAATSRDSAAGGEQGHAPSRNICCQLNSIKLTSEISAVTVKWTVHGATFHRHCGGGEGHVTATSRDSAAGGEKGHAPSRNICCQLNSIKLTSGQSMVPHFIDIVVEVKVM